jgi:NAD(P)-dependent dehydrogenase (short-subunit alcohol dehydrogenase family)
MSDTLFSVSNQVVLVSGGSRGIGKALAQGFAERGAHVWIVGRDENTLKATAAEISVGPHPVRYVPGDVMCVPHCEDAVDAVVKAHGRIDTLINVAGINVRKPAVDVTEENYDQILGINLRGAFFMAQAAGR